MRDIHSQRNPIAYFKYWYAVYRPLHDTVTAVVLALPMWWMMAAAVLWGLLFGWMIAPAHAQTLTNADLQRRFEHAPASADVYASLKQREYRPASTAADIYPAASIVVSSGSRARQTPARRLDGTLLCMPPTVYGAVPYRQHDSTSSNVFIHQRNRR